MTGYKHVHDAGHDVANFLATEIVKARPVRAALRRRPDKEESRGFSHLELQLTGLVRTSPAWPLKLVGVIELSAVEGGERRVGPSVSITDPASAQAPSGAKEPSVPEAGSAPSDPFDLVKSRSYLQLLVMAGIIGVPVSAVAYGYLSW